VSDERRACWWLRSAGSAVLVLFLALIAIAPRAPVRLNPPGFTDPVVAFELVSEPEHVFGILGRPGSAERGGVAVRMRIITQLDFLFLLAYPLLYVGIALLLRAHGAPPWLVPVMVGLAVVMVVGDALENLELLQLMSAVDPASMRPALARLRVFTLAKWYALYAASGMAALFIWRERGWWRWSAPFFGLAGLLGLVSLVHLPAIEWSQAPIGVAWVMTYVRSFSRSRRTASAGG
jgi:hypothetical protein